MIRHSDINAKELLRSIKHAKVKFAGNSRLKIYGRLDCNSGKRMNIENRVFFRSIKEALGAGYRPCGSCMREEYKNWKDGVISGRTRD